MLFRSRLENPDFARYCEAFRGMGIQVARTDEFESALRKAPDFIARERRPALIELAVDPQHITPNQSLDRIRSAAKAR